jgi:hypothetical protein
MLTRAIDVQAMSCDPESASLRDGHWTTTGQPDCDMAAQNARKLTRIGSKYIHAYRGTKY